MYAQSICTYTRARTRTHCIGKYVGSLVFLFSRSNSNTQQINRNDAESDERAHHPVLLLLASYYGTAMPPPGGSIVMHLPPGVPELQQVWLFECACSGVRRRVCACMYVRLCARVCACVYGHQSLALITCTQQNGPKHNGDIRFSHLIYITLQGQRLQQRLKTQNKVINTFMNHLVCFFILLYFCMFDFVCPMYFL